MPDPLLKDTRRQHSPLFDACIGKRIRQVRRDRQRSQEWLGQQLGLTFQQIQKYENGANRVSAGRLWIIAGLLNVPIEYFFEELPNIFVNGADTVDAAEPPHQLSDLAHDIGRNLDRIENKSVCRLLSNLVATLAERPADLRRKSSKEAALGKQR